MGKKTILKNEKEDLELFKHTNRVQAEQICELRNALMKIAKMGQGMREEVIDWKNIGRNAVFTAQDVLAAKCRTCGQKVRNAQ